MESLIVGIHFILPREFQVKPTLIIPEGKKINKYIYAKRNAANRYMKRNKEKYKERIDCQCGGHYTYWNKTRHLKSKKHNTIN